jgi:tight adherence protein B
MSELAGAALLAGLAIAATIREPPGQLVERRLKAVHSGGRPGANRSGPGWSWLLYSWRVRLAIAAVAVLWMGATPRLLVPAVLVGGVAVGALTVRTRLAARKQIALRQTRLVGACDQLAAELSAGQPPPRALEHAAAAWPDLLPVAASARLGGDVPTAWRTVAELPGARPLRTVAAAWQVAERSGAGLAVVLERMSDALRAEDAVRREVDAALGPSRATARMLAVLPAFGLLLGIGMGGDPVGFLLTTPLGAGCLAIGSAFAVTGIWWVDRLAQAAQR